MQRNYLLLLPSNHIHEASGAYTALFQMCAPTLEKLYWRSAIPSSDNGNVVTLADVVGRLSSSPSTLSFPRLRSLNLKGATVNEAAITAFLSAPDLRHLALPLEAVDMYAHILDQFAPRLETFVANIRCTMISRPATATMAANSSNSRTDTAPVVARFLEKLAASKTLTKLYLKEAPPVASPRDLAGGSAVGAPIGLPAMQPVLDSYIVPILEQEHLFDNCTRNLMFHSLQSLTLDWLSIPSDRALAAIGRLTNLRQLCLAGGSIYGSHPAHNLPPAWDVDHTYIAWHLRGLVHLQKLAFLRDQYSPPTLPTHTQTPSPHPGRILPLSGLNYYSQRKMTPKLAGFADSYLTDKDKVTMAINAMNRSGGAGGDGSGVSSIDDRNNDIDRNRRRNYTRYTIHRRITYSAHLWHPAMLQDDAQEDNPRHVRSERLNRNKDRDFRFSTWERAHRNRMLAFAEEYAAQLPALEWAYIGQRPIGITRGGGGEHGNRDGDGDDDGDSDSAGVHARPLTEHRDPCTAFIEHTFSLGTPM